MGQPKVLCDVMYDRNPRVFLDIEIGGVHAGRMILELFADTTPKAAEYFRALCTGENGVGKNGNRLHYKGTSIRAVYGRFCEGGCWWTAETFAGEYYEKVPTRGDLFFNKGSRWFKIGFRESWRWDDMVFGKILHGMDVLKAIESVDNDRGGTTKPVIIVNSGQIDDGKCLIYRNLKNYGPKYHNLIKGSRIQHRYVYRSGKEGIIPPDCFVEKDPNQKSNVSTELNSKLSSITC